MNKHDDRIHGIIAGTIGMIIVLAPLFPAIYNHLL
jgi:hypothetical protein